MPNVDNVFRIIPVDDTSHYEIIAIPGAGKTPSQWTLQVHHSIASVADSQNISSVLIDTDIVTRQDGSFTLTVGPEPANGKPNHVQTVPGAGLLLIRDTIADWERESPYDLKVRRIEGDAPSNPETDTSLAAKTVDLVKREVPLITRAKSESFFKPAANTLPAPKIREGGRWGLSSAGHFQLADDEALVLTLDSIGANYLSVQLANGWLGSLDYIHHTASLNMTQSDVNADGTYTFVISPRDPGVRNWLDTTQLHEGSIFVRWQKLPQPLSPAGSGVRSVKLVKLSELAGVMPGETRRVTAEERRQQLAKRAGAYLRRFADR